MFLQLHNLNVIKIFSTPQQQAFFLFNEISIENYGSNKCLWEFQFCKFEADFILNS